MTDLQPVLIAVGDNFYSAENAFYHADTYCKWKIQSSGHKLTLLDILDANVYPVTDRCDYDGLVVYDGPNTSAPMIGKADYYYLSVHY